MKPSAYSPEVAKQICDLLASGLSLREICRRDDMPAQSTVYLWVSNDHEGFSEQYARAREAQAHFLADEILEIADDGSNDWVERQQGEDTITVVDHEHIQRSKVRIDSRKWLMSKLAPKRYGEKLAVTGADGKDLIPPDSTDPTRMAALLLAVLREPKAAAAPAAEAQQHEDE